MCNWDKDIENIGVRILREEYCLSAKRYLTEFQPTVKSTIQLQIENCLILYGLPISVEFLNFLNLCLPAILELWGDRAKKYMKANFCFDTAVFPVCAFFLRGKSYKDFDTSTSSSGADRVSYANALSKVPKYPNIWEPD